MKLKKSALVAIISAVIGLGSAGQAAASIYGGSATSFSSFLITVTDIDGAAAGDVNNFDFTVNSTATLNNGTPVTTNGTCSGTPASNDCAAVTTDAANTLSVGAANAGGGTVTRLDTDYTTLFGPGTQQYANANTRIATAQLVDFVPSAGNTIAESEIQAGTSASSAAEISSGTAFTFQFTVDSLGQLAITFEATKYLLAAIDDNVAATALAKASMDVAFELSNDGTGDSWNWDPNGNTGSNVLGIGCDTDFADCNVTASDFDLNDLAQVSTLTASSLDKSEASAGSFAANTGLNLVAGDYTLTLFIKNSVVVTRSVESIPEPSTLLLLGAGLAGLGFTRSRRKRS